ncbi:MAG: hypothetical protein QF908_00465 [Dehalococcoidia bacterium]|jgi:hypothetical protein|nr:hypothetical protein [Dehalococcoidia bacterium]|tara:strand:- start:61 stop:1155 length:1095 start_codon:yes stop_codon:yes gene_type:complete
MKTNRHLIEDHRFDLQKFYSFPEESPYRYEIIKELTLHCSMLFPKEKGTLLRRRVLDLLPDELKKYVRGEKQISRWITEESEVNGLFEISKIPPEIEPYVRKLQLIQGALFSNAPERIPLRDIFVEHAKRCMYLFSDPQGKVVDLYAQWVIVHEYYSRQRIGSENTQDLDDLMDYSPWEDGGIIYKTAWINKKVSIPVLGAVMPTYDDSTWESEKINKILSLKEDINGPLAIIFSQLRIPVYFAYWSKTQRDLVTIDRPEHSDDDKATSFQGEFLMEEKTLRSKGGWRKLLHEYLSGEVKTTRSALQSSNATDVQAPQTTEKPLREELVSKTPQMKTIKKLTETEFQRKIKGISEKLNQDLSKT